MSDLLAAKNLMDQGDMAGAMVILMKQLDNNPDDVDVLFMLGSILIKQDKRGLAFNIYRRAAALAPDKKEVWVNFGRCQDDTPEGWEKALECFNRALQIDPKYAIAMSNIATIHIQKCEPKEARVWAKRCLKADPTVLAGQRALAFAYLMEGKWEKGWKAYESMMGTEHRQDVHYDNLPLWDGSPGETVVVYGEQGVGDELLYSSVLEDMSKDCTVVYDTLPRLERLLKRSLPDVHVVGSRYQKQLHLPEGVTPTARIPVAGVPVYYRKKDSDYTGKPYLKTDEQIRSAMRGLLDSLGNKPKIGIAWKGGSDKTRGHFRDYGLEEFLPIIRNINADFISLRYKDPSEEIENLKENHNVTVHHFPWVTEGQDHDVVAGLVAELDLVISVPTSVTQLAGGMGVETWVLVPPITGWLFFNERYPWANSVKTFHDWTFKDIEKAMIQWLQKRNDKAA